MGDTRVNGLEQPARPTLYVNLMQRPRSSATVVMRFGPRGPSCRHRGAPHSERGGAGLAASVPHVPEQIYAASLGQRHFDLTLVMTFAGTALILAVAGIYGVMSIRSRSGGARSASGSPWGRPAARCPDHRRKQGLATTAIGVTLGVVAALGLTRTIEHLLFGVAPTDPVTFASVIATLTAAAMLACYVPARRATNVEPLKVLRED